jgi:ferric-dicitrate binding protein FerR (iron transport regulator)
MKESQFILLLSKRFSGEITPEESTLLDEWLRQSPDNEQFAKENQRVWEKAEGYGKTFSPDLSADFQKVQARIQTVAPTQLRASLGQRLMRAAAVVALLLASIWGWQQFSTPSTTDLIVSADMVARRESINLRCYMDRK